jgi:type I restriction enzyme S subunit
LDSESEFGDECDDVGLPTSATFVRSRFVQSLLPAGVPSDWQLVAAGRAVTSSQYGLSEPEDRQGDTRIVGMKHLCGGKVIDEDLGIIQSGGADLSMYRLHEGDLLLNRTNSPDLVGKVAIVEATLDAVFASYLVRLRTAEDVDPHFLNYWLNSDTAQRAIKRISTRAISQANVNPTEFKRNCPVPLPPIREQQRIASILRTWDAAIDIAERLVAAKELRLSQLALGQFENHYANKSALRMGNDLFGARSERGRTFLPLLAVMQDVGIVRRDELERRVVMPEGDISAYKTVEAGDFVISLRSFEGGIEYSTVEGLVSPAYTVLRAAAEIEPNYYRLLFKSRSFIGRLDRIIFGIRDGKQISFGDFSELILPYPSPADQRAAVEVLSAATTDVLASKRHRDAIQRQKRGLMQKLLTGEWRTSERGDAA